MQPGFRAASNILVQNNGFEVAELKQCTTSKLVFVLTICLFSRVHHPNWVKCEYLCQETGSWVIRFSNRSPLRFRES